MFLGEVHSGVSSTQVVVKELKVSASVQEQMQFLEEAQPYRWVAPGDRQLEGHGPVGQDTCNTGGSVPPCSILQSGHPVALAGPCSTAVCSSAWLSVLR